ncbi:hypothetical protein QR680_015892 [Steinernema hermaphroditum]|uniref:Uncharacterized protein n=1 Tax=Steinernema hermaphroditum TaxID=289476 RepID=A0AA39LLI8_9BILA|nr:hypothetical protein QR680_015892 [Steinernema hermaphroditum]
MELGTIIYICDWLLFAFPLIAGLLYARIIYIFISTKEYRSLECYKIMIQLGVVQITTGVIYSVQALSIVLGYPPWNVVERLAIVCTKAEIALSFVLSLNRLKILTGLRYSDHVHKILTCFIWLYLVGYQALALSPLVSFYSVRPHVVPRYDNSDPCSYLIFRIGSY